MEMEVTKNEDKQLEIRLKDVDVIVLKLIVEKLNGIKDVEFAACTVEHPLLGTQKLFVKTKKGEPSKLIEKVIEELKTEVNKFSSNFKK
ncbi:MAG TPA: RpoL/Rpb11 RNA polymerase subunit family protein [Candidatus Bilamarchaeaceae archaeon]|nr:RpoL/Rpb11 RNA polymerase subunit family protein [Candidatus Bilamarchaeaceae archaeon]